MRISDGSSDVCSSDLRPSLLFRLQDRSQGLCAQEADQRLDGAAPAVPGGHRVDALGEGALGTEQLVVGLQQVLDLLAVDPRALQSDEVEPGKQDRKSVVSGKSVSVRVDLGGRRIIK